jgi:hypothetical protein
VILWLIINEVLDWVIGFINTFLYNLSYSQSITIIHHKWLPKTRSILTGLQLSSLLVCLLLFSPAFWLLFRLTCFRVTLRLRLTWLVWVWVFDYDRRSVSQSVLEYSTHLGLTTRFLLLSDSCGFVDVGRPLWREDGSVVCNCCWTSPAQSFPDPSPVGLVTIFYCIRFETSLFVTTYDSQGYKYIRNKGTWRGPHRKHSVTCYHAVP